MIEGPHVIDRGSFLKFGAAAPLSTSAFNAPAMAQALQALHVLTVPTDAAKQVLYAQQAGLFQKRGFNVDIGMLTNGAATFSAVIGGSADFAAGSLFPVFQAYAHGLPIRIVAPISMYDTNRADMWLVVRRDSPIQTARDLNGKIMAGDAPDDIGTVSVRAWVDQHGGDGKSLRMTELSPREQLAAIDQGRIDTAGLRPPYLTAAMQSQRFRVIGKPLDAVAPRFLFSCWIATTDYIAKNPQTVKAFVDSLTEAGHYTNAHQAETVAMVSKFSGQNPAMVAAGVRTIIGEQITTADVQKPLDFAYRHGVVDKQYDAKAMLSQFVPMLATRVPGGASAENFGSIPAWQAIMPE
jgi:NitT/TauT family transport system substrate-binding protein